MCVSVWVCVFTFACFCAFFLAGEVPAILSVKKLVPVVSAAAARIEREDVDEVTAKQKHHKSHKKRKADE